MDILDLMLNTNIDSLSKMIKEGKLTADELQNALVLSASDSKIELMSLIIKHGANINSCPKNGIFQGDYPLLQAVTNGEFVAFEFLISNNADVNIQSKNNGNTPLKAAIDYEWTSASEGYNPAFETSSGYKVKPEMYMSRILFEHGANPFVKNYSGSSAYDYARQFDYKEALELFSDYKQQ